MTGYRRETHYPEKMLVALTASDKQKLEQLAAVQGTSMSEVVRRLIRRAAA